MKRYKTYVFKERDPIIDDTLALIDTTFADISRRSGVAAGTLTNWKKGRTRRPQFCTVAAVGGAAGMQLVWQRKKDKR
jgi:hypothetical protein